MSEQKGNNAGMSSAPAAATTQRKPRTLADLVEEQVKGGQLDPNELNKPVVWGERAGSSSRPKPQGGGRRWNEPSYDQGRGNGYEAPESSDSSSLNWQQRELLAGQPDHQRSFQQAGFNNRRSQTGGRSDGYQDRRAPQPQRTEQQPRQAPRGKPPGGDLPEWATDLDANSSSEGGALNWQQKSLLNRDESNPFNRLVRGEDEYYRE